MFKFYRLFLGIFTYLILLTGCGKFISKFPPLPQDDYIQVYFNHNQTDGREYLDPYRNFTRQGDNLEEVLINAVNSANSTIDIAVQELNLMNLARAIAQRHKQGIKVRIVLENDYNLPLNKLPNDHGLRVLKETNIPIIDDTEDGSKGSGLMHHKFMVIDNQKVITGSANFTISGIHGDLDNPNSRGNTNHILVFNSGELAQIFTEEFNYLWGDGVGNKKDSLFGVQKPQRSQKMFNIGNSFVMVKFSPKSRGIPWENTTNGVIAENLKKANQSIDLALFVFSDQKIANTLEKESSQGVTIRALIDRNFIYQYYSEGLDLLGVQRYLPTKCEYQKNNQPWQNPLTAVGVADLDRGDKLHHKFAIIDNSKVITGSHNWSYSANHINDETLLVIDNSAIAQHFRREFDSLFQSAIVGIPPYIEKRIEEENTRCGSRK